MRRLLLGVSGSVSVYKSVELARRLQDYGFFITVIPTPASNNFVGNALWEAITQNPVADSLWKDIHSSSHLKLALENEIFVVAPATANLISELASGSASYLLSATFLSFTGRKILVPAMHTQMWENSITQKNVATLRESGVEIIEPEIGQLAGGDYGVGRYPELSKIITKIFDGDLPSAKYQGKKILITNGPTREPIDPVRFLGNNSSGKQGFAFTQALLDLGAKIELITTVTPNFKHPNLNITLVDTAIQMLEAVKVKHVGIDYSILVAAVADKRPANYQDQKIKKNLLDKIVLIENPDIAGWVGENKGSTEKILIFAAETGENATQNALEKLQKKKADMLYMNRVDQEVFNSEESHGILLKTSGEQLHLQRSSKYQIAKQILDKL